MPVTTTTTAAPPSLEYLPPVSLFPDANENSQVSLLFPTPAPPPAPTPAPVVVTQGPTQAPITQAPIVVTYIQCVGAQECVTSAVCSSRPGGLINVPAGEVFHDYIIQKTKTKILKSIWSLQCKNSLSGLVGVCCNPAPVATTTQRPVVVTTSRPVVQPVLTEEEEEIAFWDFRESIPGDPETDYPILDKIPVTSFTCVGRIDGISRLILNRHMKWKFGINVCNWFRLLRWCGYQMPSVPHLHFAAGRWSHQELFPLPQWHHFQPGDFRLPMV